MSDDILRSLERQQRREEGNLLQPDTSTIEGSQGRKVPRDPDAEKAALFEAGSGGGINSSRALEGAVIDIAYGGGDTAGGVVRVTDENRQEYETTAWEDDEPRGLDAWGGDGLVHLERGGFDFIENEKMRKVIEAFLANWKSEKSADGELAVTMSADDEGKLWVETEMNGKKGSFAAWMLIRALGVENKWTPEDKVPVAKGEFAGINRRAIESKWRKLMNKLVIDRMKGPKVTVDMTGPWDEAWKKEPEMEKKYPVEVDLDKVGRNGSPKRDAVARAIGLMRSKQYDPEFVVRAINIKTPKGDERRILVRVSCNGTHQTVGADDLFRAMPEVSVMGIGVERHWSLNGYSVDASSEPEDWERLLQSIEIIRK